MTIFPEGYATEKKAAGAGQVAHLHFDAKYRAEKIGQLFGDQNEADDDGGEVLTEEKSEDSSKALDLNLSIEIGSEFIPVGAARGEVIHGHGWRAKVKSARFLSREKLNAYLQAKLPGTQATSVEHYVLFEFDEVTDFEPLILDAVHKMYRSGSKFMAVSCRWAEIIEANEGSWAE